LADQDVTVRLPRDASRAPKGDHGLKAMKKLDRVKKISTRTMKMRMGTKEKRA
jgi:hypothetical protein